ncbi:MAG: hypothetical protein AB7O73_04885 [Bacteroidia bacterium]
METKKIYELHEEHKEWLSKLAFYKDDLGVMHNRINEVASKNTGSDVLKLVEHFQNQFIIQKNNIDELNHSIKDHETYLENRIKENSVAADHRSVNDHPKMRDAFYSFEKVFEELRHEFNAFLSKVM